MLILGIDTSTSAITAAVHGDDLDAVCTRLDARGHTEYLAPVVAEALSQAGVTVADIDHVVCGVGPGPFTGLRVGMITAEVFAYARGIPCSGVCSLDALAHAAAAEVGDGDFVVATDARRKEVYWGTYTATGGRVTSGTAPEVCRPGELPEAVRALPAAGRGPLLYPEAFGPAFGPLDVDAGALARLARALIERGETLPMQPLYLRRPDALTSAQRATP